LVRVEPPIEIPEAKTTTRYAKNERVSGGRSAFGGQLTK
jgi:hypothetical protein